VRNRYLARHVSLQAVRCERAAKMLSPYRLAANLFANEFYILSSSDVCR
jgi:hypothetical protein